MTKYCKGFCDTMPSFSRYVDGFRYCAVCDMFLQSEVGLEGICPCCHGQMRTRGRRYGSKIRRSNKIWIYPEAVIITK